LHVLRQAGTIAAGVAAALAIVQFLRSGYRRTIGRRWEMRRRLARLGTMAQLSFFTSVIGEPPALRRSVEWNQTRYTGMGKKALPARRRGHENVYVDPYFFVQALTDEDETVVAYSVTNRHRRFRPRFVSPGGSAIPKRTLFGREKFGYRPGIDVRLGRSYFSYVFSQPQ